MSESDRAPASTAASVDSNRAIASTSPPRRSWLGWLILLLVMGSASGAVWYAIERSQSAAALSKGGPRGEGKGAPGSEGKGSADAAPKSAEGKAGADGTDKAGARGDAKADGKAEPKGESVAGRKGPGGPGGGGPTVVGVRPVRVGPIDIVQTGLGTVTPRNVVTVRSRVDGPLTRVLFREGDMVKAGQLLAEIDAAPFQVALQQAAGTLARDEAQLRNARLDLERFRTLLAQDSIAKQQVDTQEALVRQFEGTLLSDRATVDNAKLQLSYTRITAPIAGRVGLRLVDPGNLVRANDATGIVTIAQIAPITVLFPIPEDALQPVLAQLKAGAKLRVEAWDRANANRLANGVLLTTDNQIDTATGTIRLRAQFANGDGALFPNQFVNVRLKLDRIEEATLVPPAAIQRGREGTFVYALDDDNRVSIVRVKPGPSTPEQVAVEGDLKAGQRVVIDGADRLRPGMRVEIAERGGEGKRGPRKGGPGGPGKGPGGAEGQPPPAAAPPAGTPAAASETPPTAAASPGGAASPAAAEGTATSGRRQSGGDGSPSGNRPPSGGRPDGAATQK
jgi:membrane fusion protein, multidrug efflux system